MIRENNTPYNGKELIIMIIFTILLAILIAIALIVLTTIIIAGSSFIAIFGDAIVFGLIPWLIVKILRSDKK